MSLTREFGVALFLKSI